MPGVTLRTDADTAFSALQSASRLMSKPPTVTPPSPPSTPPTQMLHEVFTAVVNMAPLSDAQRAEAERQYGQVQGQLQAKYDASFAKHLHNSEAITRSLLECMDINENGLSTLTIAGAPCPPPPRPPLPHGDPVLVSANPSSQRPGPFPPPPKFNGNGTWVGRQRAEAAFGGRETICPSLAQ